MTTASDSNVSNPKKFSIIPPDPVAGAPVDDYTIDIGPSDANNTAPTTFPISVKVPQADLTPQLDGSINVPFPDIVTTMLAAGTYGARCEADSGAVVGDPTPVIFFNITAPKPGIPKGFSLA